MAVQISPSILGADFSNLAEEIKRCEEAGADSIHFDIMDRHFVPNLSFGPMLLKALRKHTDLPFKVHLMVDDPDLYIDECIEYGAAAITVQAEASLHLHRTLSYIKDRGALAGIAVNPSTALTFLPYVAPVTDEILVMTVNPGFSGQSTILSVLPKIREVFDERKKLNRPIGIEVDGGMNYENGKKAIELGADSLVMASAFFGAGNRARLVSELKALPLRN